jgi:hypothetical protein
MNNLSLTDFQIFPSQYEEDGDGNKCCWLGGYQPSDNAEISLQPYKTDAISGNTNPKWGFHMGATGKPDEYRLKYVLMSDPLGQWHGVAVNDGKLVLKHWKEGDVFIVKKIGQYYTVEYSGKHAECENGNLGKNTTIDLWNITPPTPQQVLVYNNIPAGSFRILWKFVKMDQMSGRDWLTRLNAAGRNKDKLDRLFIPGTHDSGTEENTQWLRTQCHTIAEQAAMGVRYFDLRVADNWKIYHNTSNSGIYLDYVVNTVVDHFKSHRDEFFFLQITPQTATGFSQRLFDYLGKYCTDVFAHIYLPDTMPTLEDAKGKVFFFARYQPDVVDPKFKEHQIEWQDNISGGNASINPFNSPQVYVQDRYDNESNDDKFKKYIVPTLDNKMFKGVTDWVINFTSVSNAAYPVYSSGNINPKVANLLMWAAPEPCGLLVMDYARVGSVANIIALNFD